MPTVENAAIWSNAKTVTHHLDVVDCAVLQRTRFDSLFGEKLVGARHAEDGRPYSEDEADYLL